MGESSNNQITGKNSSPKTLMLSLLPSTYTYSWFGCTCLIFFLQYTHSWCRALLVYYNEWITLWKWFCSGCHGYKRWRKYVNKVLSLLLLFFFNLVLSLLSFLVIELSLYFYCKKMQMNITSVSEAHSLWVFLIEITMDYLLLASLCTDVFLCL